MEILKKIDLKVGKEVGLVILYFLRSSRKRCIEGYCVSIHRYNLDTGEVIEGSLNIFGEGIYSKRLAEDFHRVVCKCALCTLKPYESLIKKNNSVPPQAWDLLKSELEDVWCSIDRNGVPGDIKDLNSIYSFIKRWDDIKF